MGRLHRVMMLSGLAVLLALGTATSAFGYSTSVTGASGRITTPAASDPDYCLLTTCLWATTTTVGDCARWQKWNKTYAAWEWYGKAACTLSREELVAYSAPNGAYRLCRAYAGNCGPSWTVNW